MSKVGRIVTDPKVGAYCQITLESGDKILLSHDRASLTSGTLTVTEVKWWGFASGAILFTGALHTPEGQAVLADLVRGTAARDPRATPLSALVERLRACRSLEEVQRACAAIGGGTRT